MFAATDAVCLADSDDEDYVSFDQNEMETGIQELYSDESASDAGSDMSNPDNNFDDLLETEAVDQMLTNKDYDNNTFDLFSFNDNESAIKNESNKKKKHKSKRKHNKHSSKMHKKGKKVPKTVNNNNINVKRSSGGLLGSLMGGLFGGSSSNTSNAPVQQQQPKSQQMNNNLNNINENDEDDDDESEDSASSMASLNENLDDNNDRRRRSSSPRVVRSLRDSSDVRMNNNNNNKNKKHATLAKRLNRLSNFRKNKEERQRITDRKVIHKQKINTNIISIDLGTLKAEALQVVAGDPIHCKNPKCKIILSSHDKLLNKLEDNNELKVDNDSGEYIWVCQFCNTVNVIEIDDEEEKPKGDTQDYVVEPPSEAKQSDDEGLIIFCIDISGSMCVTQQVKGQFKLKGDHISEQLNEFSQFIDPGDQLNQFLPNQNRDVTWISRLQAVQAAVDEQIEAIKQEKPNFKVGLVTFSNDVMIIGDGMRKENVVVTGDKLNNLQTLQEIGRKYSVENTIGKSYEKLSESLWKLNEGGQTALGPALAVSVAMAENTPGSQVILCTDGLANIGVGSLDQDGNNNNTINANDKDAILNRAKELDSIEKWYENLGIYAHEKGVVVNVISITDDGCKLENLGKLTDSCAGEIKRINPLKLTEKFKNILGNQVLAIQTQATMFLHPGLKFFSSLSKVSDPKAKANIVQNEEQSLMDTVDMGIQPQPQPQTQAKTSVVLSENTDKDDTTVKDKETKEKEKEKETESKEDDSNNNNDDNSKETEDKLLSVGSIEEIFHSAQDIGNIFNDTSVFFEYSIRKDRISDFKQLTHLPFQCHISYKKLDGTRMLRVITQLRPIIFDRKKARENVNVDILTKYGTKITSELCSKGDYESSRAYTQANTAWLARNINSNSNVGVINNKIYQRQMISLANYTNDNMVLDHQMKKQQISEISDNNPQFQHMSFQPQMQQQQQQQQSRGFSRNNHHSHHSHLSHNNNNNANINSMMLPIPSYDNNSNDNSNDNNSSNVQSLESKSSRMHARKSARNDKFSSAVYKMKNKSKR